MNNRKTTGRSPGREDSPSERNQRQHQRQADQFRRRIAAAAGRSRSGRGIGFTHHTSLEQGGNTNFAGTFPLWDILFGTFRMPEGVLPDEYGVDAGQAVPSEIGGQLAYPFRQ
jgi:hypothetical protein